MTLAELIQEFRVKTQDLVKPYLFSDEQVTHWLIEAENEAAIRGRLIHESDNHQMCRIPLIPGVTAYALHPAVYEIDYLAIERNHCREPVKLVSRDWLDKHVPDWRTSSCWPPVYAIQSDTSIRLTMTPHSDDATLVLECYRLPICGLTTDLKSKPEIHRAHHRHLVDWALKEAYGLPDSDKLDLGKAGEAEAEFTRYFGLPVDSDLRRMTRHDVVHHVETYFP